MLAKNALVRGAPPLSRSHSTRCAGTHLDARDENTRLLWGHAQASPKRRALEVLVSNAQAREAQVLPVVAANVLEEVLQDVNGNDVAARRDTAKGETRTSNKRKSQASYKGRYWSKNWGALGKKGACLRGGGCVRRLGNTYR